MAHNFCCDSYHVPNLIYIYCIIVIMLGSSVWRVLFVGVVVRWLGFWLLCPFCLYWFSCLLVFRWMGCGWGGVPVHLLFVFCYCFLFWIGCVSSNSAIMKSDHFLMKSSRCVLILYINFINMYFRQHNYIIKTSFFVLSSQSENHSKNCKPSAIQNARNHTVKNFMVLSLAWGWLFKSKHVALSLTHVFIT